ncbi:unnamed protein product [Caenorhabditis brenneri]
MSHVVSLLTDAFADLFTEDDGFRVTQNPLWRDPNASQMKWVTHICLAFAIFVAQTIHGSEDWRTPSEIPFWLMAYSNALVAFCGSNRAFDKVIIAQLCVASSSVVWNGWWLYIPIIAVMSIGAYNRLDGDEGDAVEQ